MNPRTISITSTALAMTRLLVRVPHSSGGPQHQKQGKARQNQPRKHHHSWPVRPQQVICHAHNHRPDDATAEVGALGEAIDGGEGAAAEQLPYDQWPRWNGRPE